MGGKKERERRYVQGDPSSQTLYIAKINTVQPADIGWPTGNGKKLSNSQACCLAQLCLAAA